MTQIILNIPQSTHTKNISEAAQYFVSFSHRYPEDMEDMILGMRMRETDTEPTTPLSEFLAGISK